MIKTNNPFSFKRTNSHMIIILTLKSLDCGFMNFQKSSKVFHYVDFSYLTFLYAIQVMVKNRTTILICVDK